MPNEWEEQELKRLLEKYTAVTLPVTISIDAKQQVLDTESVKKILSTAEIISLMDCYCRKMLKNCDKPLNVCISFNEGALHALKNEGAREISLQEALTVLEMSHKAGLVHLAYYTEGKECTIICSCCSCCCHHLIGLRRVGYHEVVVKSDFVAAVDGSVCTECELCVERCQFGAWTTGDDGVTLDQDRCFGCGLCVSSCPAGAISFLRR